MVDVLFAASHAVIPNRFSQFNSSRSAPKRCHARPVTASAGGATSKTEEYDVVVVGSGLGGLSAAAVASAGYGLSVCVLEAHTIAGGAAHSFTRKTDRGLRTHCCTFFAPLVWTCPLYDTMRGAASSRRNM